MKAAGASTAAKKSTKRNKYNVAPVEERTLDGIVFDSKGEMQRFVQLRKMEEEGLISDLIYHRVYRIVVNGILICKYESDFEYMTHQDLSAVVGRRRIHWLKGQHVVEDYKGRRTPVYNMKRTLMKAVFEIDIYETSHSVS